MIIWCLSLVESKWQIKGKRTHGWSPYRSVLGALSIMKERRMKYIQHSYLLKRLSYISSTPTFSKVFHILPAHLPFKKSFIFFLYSGLPMLFVVLWTHCSQRRNDHKGSSDRESNEWEEEDTSGLDQRNQISWIRKHRWLNASPWTLWKDRYYGGRGWKNCEMIYILLILEVRWTTCKRKNCDEMAHRPKHMHLVYLLK